MAYGWLQVLLGFRYLTPNLYWMRQVVLKSVSHMAPEMLGLTVSMGTGSSTDSSLIWCSMGVVRMLNEFNFVFIKLTMVTNLFSMSSFARWIDARDIRKLLYLEVIGNHFDYFDYFGIKHFLNVPKAIKNYLRVKKYNFQKSNQVIKMISNY